MPLLPGAQGLREPKLPGSPLQPGVPSPEAPYTAASGPRTSEGWSLPGAHASWGPLLSLTLALEAQPLPWQSRGGGAKVCFPIFKQNKAVSFLPQNDIIALFKHQNLKISARLRRAL